MSPAPRIAAVAIGRNEGARLAACLDSLAGLDRVVYVDSGSSDASPETAAARGAEVVRLDPAIPFTAARARNAGLARLAARGDRPDYVQMIDGDCTLDPGWIATAAAFLAARPRAAVACGRRRERHPEASVYNRLCDREWDTPVGPARACGGDALMRMTALADAGGYRESLIAGEEPELCLRLRAAGWEVWRLDAEMTLHDAAMTRLSQWWRRARRAGHAAAEGAALHGTGPERHGVRPTLSALGWAGALPAAALGLGALHPAGLALLLAWPAQTARMARRAGGRRADWVWAGFTMAAKLPEMLGALDYALARARRRPARIIEYKGEARG